MAWKGNTTTFIRA